MDSNNYLITAMLNRLVVKKEEVSVPEPEFTPFNLSHLRYTPKTLKPCEESKNECKETFRNVTKPLPA
jgi:hypothetical protein